MKYSDAVVFQMTDDRGPFSFKALNSVALPKEVLENGPLPPGPHPSIYGRPEVLEKARDCVMRDRAATHGAVEESFSTLARIWSARLGVTLTPEQVTIMMVDLKTVRAWKNPGHLDNWVDMAGYAACGGELAAIPFNG